jgi:hypothetical protein
MAKKHLIVIHGRASKPSHQEKLRLVKLALGHGLGRVDPNVAKDFERGALKFTFVYYGDISNRLLVERDADLAASLRERDPDHDDAPCESAGSYDASLERLLAQKDFGAKAYRELLKRVPDQGALDDIASLLSPAASVLGLSERIIRRVTPDMGAYMTSRKIGSAIRERLAQPLKAALLAGDDICLVSHSMGCIVAYDVLWKLSQMSEYVDVQESGNRVARWLTLGCPLGEPGVRGNLYDNDERADGRYPKKIVAAWVNAAAKDDFIAHDATMADDFQEMLAAGYVDSLHDLPGICTFWVGDAGANPHKFYGYLDHPDVARQIASWATSGG